MLGGEQELGDPHRERFGHGVIKERGAMTAASCGRGDEEVDHPDTAGVLAVVSVIAVFSVLAVASVGVGSGGRFGEFAIESEAD
jgi:hypothetical protein